MEIDYDRIREIIERKHTFYDSEITRRTDNRLHTYVSDYLYTHFKPDMRVLDIGCGNGSTLIHGQKCFSYGLGTDNDEEHLRIADQALKESGVTNVEFQLLDFEDNADMLESESFDFVFTERGPLDVSPLTIESSVRVLKPNGLLLNTQIGKQHKREITRVFEYEENDAELSLEQVQTELEKNGIEIRVVADFLEKWIYPDVYEWLRDQANIWIWLGESLPAPEDPRIQVFAEQSANSSGEIEVTHHVTWIGGVKL